MQLYVTGESDVGRERQQNEDHMDLRQLRDGSWLMVVCDGMGGHEAGDVASEVATRSLVRCVSDRVDTEQPPRVLWDALQAANEAVVREAFDRGVQGMGTTAVVGWVRGDMLWVAWVGDSRLYHFREGRLELRTEDHTRVQKMVDMQILSPQEAKNHPDAHILTQALGKGGDNQSGVRPSVWSEPSRLEPGDALVLCSDGLFDMVEDEELYPLVGGLHHEEAVARLIRTANDRGGHDNVTVIVASVGGLALSPAQPPETRKTLVETAALGAEEASLPHPPRSTISTDNLFVPGPHDGGVEPSSHVPGGDGRRDDPRPAASRKATWLLVILGVLGGLAAGALLTVAVVVALRFVPAGTTEPEEVTGRAEVADVGTEAPRDGVHVTAVAEVYDPAAFDGVEDASGASRVRAGLGTLDIHVRSVERLHPASARTIIAIDPTTQSAANWDRTFELLERFAGALPDAGDHDVDLVFCAEEVSAQGQATTRAELEANLRTVEDGAKPDAGPEMPDLARALEDVLLLAGEDTDSDARQLLVFVDAGAELSMGEVSTLTRLARDGRVSVFPLVFGLASTDSSAIRSLRRLARESSGEVMDADAIDETTAAIEDRARVADRLVAVGLSLPATVVTNGTLDRLPELEFSSGTERAAMRTMYVDVPPVPESTGAPTTEAGEEDAG